MTRNRRPIVTVAAVLCGVAAVGSLGSWWVLQSNWFRDEVRRRIVAEVERTTGGRVELGSFDYDWHTLTADFSGFTVHGTEPSAAPPLLHVNSLRVTLKIVSLLERNVDIASLTVERPEIALQVHPDGSTNIPAPRFHSRNKNLVEQLLDLKMRHIAVNGGVLRVNEQRVPLDFTGNDIDLLVDYRRAGPAYKMRLNSREVRISSSEIHPEPFALNVQGRLQRDGLSVELLKLSSGDSNALAKGTVRRFANPQVDLQLDGVFTAKELAAFTNLRNLPAGRFALHGTGHYDKINGPSFNGKATARQVAYISRPFSLKDIDAEADVLASGQGLTLKRLVASSRGARLIGEAYLKHYRTVQADGNITGLALHEVASYFTSRPLLWSGVAAGRIQATAALDARNPDFVLQARGSIAAAPDGIPVSGDVDLTYHQRGNGLEFGPSHVTFPSSNMSFAGMLAGGSHLTVDSANLNDLKPALTLFDWSVPSAAIPVLLAGGSAHFDGTLTNPLSSVGVDGQIALKQFRLDNRTFNQARSDFTLGANGVEFRSFSAQQACTQLSGAGQLGFDNWFIGRDSQIRAALKFQGVDIVTTLARFSSVKLPIIRGVASGSANISGTLAQPQGSAHISSDSLDAYGERLNQIRFDADLKGTRLQITEGRVQSQAAVINFSGTYRHSPASWLQGDAGVKADTNGFPLASLSPVRKFQPGLNARAEIHLQAAARITPSEVQPSSANGTLDFRDITLNDVPVGDLRIKAATGGQTLHANFSGDLRHSPLDGSADVQLTAGTPAKGSVKFEKISLASLYALSGLPFTAPVEGYLQGALNFSGPLEHPASLQAALEIEDVHLNSKAAVDVLNEKPAEIVLANEGPIVIDAADGIASVRHFQIGGKDTSLNVTGSFPYLRAKASAQNALALKVEGSANMQIFQLFDPNVQASGVSVLSASIGGTFRDPDVKGSLAIKDGSFFLENVPNGLSAVNGTVTFNQNRATLQKMTAHSGGGELSLGGFVSFGGGPLVYQIDARAQNVRVRYAGSISVTANSTLRLSGTSASSILSGTLTISRVVFTPNTDVGNLLASFGGGAASPTSENEFLSGLHLDIVIESSPNLQLSTALSRDVEAEINLRLRGTPDHPIFLGNLAANQGDIRVFGTRYSINRGEVSFINPVKIEPILDLDLETQARGITVDITISGTFSKLNINYRSDPPLQPRDIIALLTVGRNPDSTIGAPSTTPSDTSALASGANTVLGAAISPVSDRLSKLFGITNIKIDPLVQGITNTPQARLTVEQQISRDITVTYVTNLSQTSEQIFRLEWALSRQFAIVALRDDNGEFGIDFQYKRRFK